MKRRKTMKIDLLDIVGIAAIYVLAGLTVVGGLAWGGLLTYPFTP